MELEEALGGEKPFDLNAYIVIDDYVRWLNDKIDHERFKLDSYYANGFEINYLVENGRKKAYEEAKETYIKFLVDKRNEEDH